MWKSCTQTMGMWGVDHLSSIYTVLGLIPCICSKAKWRTIKYCDHSFLNVTLLKAIECILYAHLHLCVFMCLHMCGGECACLWQEAKTDIRYPSSITVLLTYLILLGLSPKLYLISLPRLVSQKTPKTHLSLPLQGLELQECTTCLVFI